MNEPLQENPGADQPIDGLSIKKDGFMTAVTNNNGEDKTVLEQKKANIRSHYEKLITQLETMAGKELALMAEEKVFMKDRHGELKIKQEEYAAGIRLIGAQLTTILEKLDNLKKQVSDKLRELGKAKEQIVSRALEALEKELVAATGIYRKLQDEQNTALEKEFQRDVDALVKKAKFWEGVYETCKAQFNGVSARIGILQRDGLNPALARFLIYAGGVAVLVAGWWFNVWAGPGKIAGAASNVSGNTDVSFFLVENLGRYLGGYSMGAMLGMIFCYTLLVGGVSALCYYLLKKFGYIRDFSVFLSKGSDKDDSPDEYALQEKKLLQFNIRANSWWSLWLKLAPFIVLAFPVLSMVYAQVTRDSLAYMQSHGRTPAPVTFQRVFDSLSNEFIGSGIALAVTCIAVFYLIRVVENRYHDQTEKGEGYRGGRNWLLYAGFLSFGLMVASMVVYHSGLIAGDIRNVAIIGFVTAALAASVAIAYAYHYLSLKNNRDDLLLQMEAITSFIQRLSCPYQVNYTSNKQLRKRLYRFQQEVMDLIEGRHVLAGQVSASLDEEQVIANELKENPEAKIDKKYVHRTVWSFLRQVGRRVRKLFKRVKKNGYDRQVIERSGITDDDLRYFPELSLQLGDIREQIRELEEERANLLRQQLEYFRNEGTTRSISDQISNLEKELAGLDRKVIARMSEYALKARKLDDLRKTEVILFTEGYYTGIWYKNYITKTISI